MIFIDKLDDKIKAKLQTFEESGMGYWLVKVKLKDGGFYSNVCITENFKFGFPNLIIFKLKDIIDIEWDGFRGSKSSGKPIKISGF